VHSSATIGDAECCRVSTFWDVARTKLGKLVALIYSDVILAPKRATLICRRTEHSTHGTLCELRGSFPFLSPSEEPGIPYAVACRLLRTASKLQTAVI
jgi:hypothetical protein